jgi:hypothetical protein
VVQANGYRLPFAGLPTGFGGCASRKMIDKAEKSNTIKPKFMLPFNRYPAAVVLTLALGSG